MVYNVNCHVPDNTDADRRMRGIGGPGRYKTVDDVTSASTKGDTFHVNVAGREMRVITARHAPGPRYITAEGGGIPPNNLLRLQRCPRR